MADSIKWRHQLLLAKIEASYATDPTLTGSNNAILAKNIELRPMEGEDVSRDLLQAFLSAQATVPAGLHVVISFDTELAGSGAAGTAPAWGVLAIGCGCAETISEDTSVTYSPVSDDEESLYFKYWLGGICHAFAGARGTGVLTISAQGIPTIRWTFTGLFIDPADVTRATGTFTAYQKPLIASKAHTPQFKINDVALTMRSFAFNLGCQVERRLLVPDEKIVIVDRAESIDATVEVTALATFNPFSLAKAQTRVPVTITHGITAGNIVTVNAPTSQVRRPDPATNSQGVAERVIRLTPLSTDSGNDQFSIVLT
ncbi:phage tail tube protein [Nitrobacter winogradskyi]|uniref:Uncharacterized protein n=2 Tax=Nitrobacter winogradskyi TaxID=913 RepID=A0ACC6AGZ5_NITWI|nr:phage tail tube protein [Nitrobacter winogradskyi]MCP1998783.1 hypothetical protein [Nitrobacter winogradskyi]GEC14293.1 hypothetical protein NWI01_01850 [Nitrobacter winogradskyi]